MKLHHRVQALLDALPAGSSVTLSRETLAEWIDAAARTPDVEPDMTVEDVASLFDRSPVTVREWCRDGKLRAYRLNGREYRIPAEAVAEFQAAAGKG